MIELNEIFHILIPVFNDWDSLIKLLDQINNELERFKDHNFKIYIVNDASIIEKPKIKKPKNLKF